ncbi:sugar ABC transporter ATP-binding protein [Nocardioides bigeumensis]|uniref:Sugar ABC transporter ATP-binding protein n=1 Tax=Nocardioides bigeumensis TaxID=433657 RepID=A0ABP5KQM3_9ACTN
MRPKVTQMAGLPVNDGGEPGRPGPLPSSTRAEEVRPGNPGKPDRPGPDPGTPRWRRAEVASVSKCFGAIQALDDVSVEFRTGSVHGLLGQNGAGKSTLIKVLNGLVRPDAGQLRIDENPTPFAGSPAWQVSTAYQELTLVPYLSVAENLVLGRRREYGVTSFESTVAAASEILRRWRVDDVDPRKPVKSNPLPVRQRIEIVRALERTDQVLVLDEPTSALDPAGADWLKGQIRHLRDRGVAVVIVSHRLAEIEDVCDYVTVLRDGRAVASESSSGLNEQKIATLMLGREMLQTQRVIADRHDEAPRATNTVLEVQSLSVEPALRDVSLTLGEGEVLGVGGLEGQGQHALFMTLFGAQRPTRGEVLVGGRAVRLKSPRRAIRAGIGMVPEDRKTEGLMLQRTVRENLTLPALRRVSRAGVVSPAKEAQTAAPAMASLGLAAGVFDNAASSLSGGNQQKVVAAKWLVADSRILLMFDPLRGVDVGARQEFFAWMTTFAAGGGAVLFYSSDIDELTTVCDRVITIYRGVVTGSMAGSEITRERVLAGMLGGDS